jgi:hypothetical protein
MLSESGTISSVPSENQGLLRDIQPRLDMTSKSSFTPSASPISNNSPRMPTYYRAHAGRKDDVTQYNPYRKPHAVSTCHVSSGLPNKEESTRPLIEIPYRSPNCYPSLDTRRLSYIGMDSSTYGKSAYSFNDDEAITTPLTPLTQHSDDMRTYEGVSFPYTASNNPHYTTPHETSTVGQVSQDNNSNSKAARRRRAHLQSEQRRREHIKDGMNLITNIVPACRESRDIKNLSKASILRHAHDYVVHLIQELQHWKKVCASKDQEIADLRRHLGVSPSPPQWHQLHATYKRTGE